MDRAHLAELAVSAIPGAVLGVAVAAALATVQVPAALVPVIVVSGAAGFVAVAVVVFAARKLD